MRILRNILFILVMLPLVSSAQSEKYLSYISKYKDLAIAQMRKHNIPASITMAQGLLESAAGTSMLAVKGKNHFGIKCHSDWTGPYLLKNDDAPNERFRVYAFVEDSYEDHSLFLVGRRRYASLFQLPITDYRAWAHELKAAGYATNPTYAQKLIQIIEDYKLTDLDQEALARRHPQIPETIVIAETPLPAVVTPTNTPQKHVIAVNNRNYYVITLPGDTYSSLAQEYETTERKLRKYNEVDKHYKLKAGDIVYFEKKQSKAHKSLKNKYHILKSGESLYFVAQRYGVRLKSLYKLNALSADHMPMVGQKLKLR